MYRSVMSSAVRNDLKTIFEWSVSAVKPNSLIKSFIQINENQLLVKTLLTNSDQKFLLNDRDVYIIGAGKAVLKMCEEFLNQLDSYNQRLANSRPKLAITSGLLSVPVGSRTGSPLFAKYNVEYRCGALNNMPDTDSINSTQLIVNLIKSVKSKSPANSQPPLFISFISGGGSTLLSLPKPGLTLAEKCALISRLVKSGANINELNFVRRCLSQVKGGKLARMAISSPNSVQMVSFIISDIIGDPIELIASGPTIMTSSDIATSPSVKALEILKQFNIEVKDNISEAIRSEDNDSRFGDTNSDQLLHNIMIGNNSIALNVAQSKATQLGYKVIYLGNTIKGEARDVANNWIGIALDYKPADNDMTKYKGICWIGGGETTVNMTATKPGLGGRCQEMGLAFYTSVHNTAHETKLYLMCAGTDGQDGPTDVAGVIAENMPTNSDPTGQILIKANNDLKNHNSYQFFKTYYNDWFLKTGVTGTNVMDIYCMIKII